MRPSNLQVIGPLHFETTGPFLGHFSISEFFVVSLCTRRWRGSETILCRLRERTKIRKSERITQTLGPTRKVTLGALPGAESASVTLPLGMPPIAPDGVAGLSAPLPAAPRRPQRGPRQSCLPSRQPAPSRCRVVESPVTPHPWTLRAAHMHRAAVRLPGPPQLSFSSVLVAPAKISTFGSLIVPGTPSAPSDGPAARLTRGFAPTVPAPPPT